MGVAIIHVLDEANPSASRDFRCDIKLLLAHMKLLAADLADVPGHDIEITVKCDVPTFAWLMAYVKSDSRGQQPQTSLGNCLQLLLASHYLQMAPVLRSSVDLIAANLPQLTQSAAQQLCSLGKCLLQKLAKAVQEETLESVLHLSNTHHQHQQDSQQSLPGRHSPQHTSTSSSTTSSSSSGPVSMLVEKLYKHKLRALLQQHGTSLLRCRTCGQLFASASHHKLQCPLGTAPSSRQPNKLPLHEPDPGWDLQAFLAQQRAATAPTPAQMPDPATYESYEEAGSSSWRRLYWLVWGHVTVLYCQRCCGHFPARLLHECRYHPQAAVFGSDRAIGSYPCCRAPAWHPRGSAVVAAASAAVSPCCSRDHQAYVPAGDSSGSDSSSSSKGSRAKQASGKADGAGGGVGVSAAQSSQGAAVGPARALQLLQLYGPLITAALPASIQQQQQEAQSTGSQGAPSVAGSPSQRGPVLPLLVKMVNRGAAAAAAAEAGRREAAPSPVAAGLCGSTSSRPGSVSPLPPISSPRQWSTAEQGTQARERHSSSNSSQQRQQELSLPAAAAAAIAAASAAGGGGGGAHGQQVRAVGYSRSPLGSRPARACEAGSISSNSSSRSSSRGSSSRPSWHSDGSSRHRASAADAGEDADGSSYDSQRRVQGQTQADGYNFPAAKQQQQQPQLGSDGARSSDSEGDDLCMGGAHTTPLSSVMGAVRAAAQARTRGMGFNSITGTGSGTAAGGYGSTGGSGAGLLQPHLSAPLVETFSAGGRRVLAAAAANKRNKPLRPTAGPPQLDSPSRPSTAASLLSLSSHHHHQQQQQQQQSAGQGPSRPSTGTGAGAGSRPWSGAGAGAGISSGGGGVRGGEGVASGAAGADSVAGGLASMGAAFNRTLLLELVQQDDAYRMGVLMRKLDSLRLQPPPDVVAGRSAGKRQPQGTALEGRSNMLTQAGVAAAVNGVVFRSKYACN